MPDRIITITGHGLRVKSGYVKKEKGKKGKRSKPHRMKRRRGRKGGGGGGGFLDW